MRLYCLFFLFVAIASRVDAQSLTVKVASCQSSSEKFSLYSAKQKPLAGAQLVAISSHLSPSGLNDSVSAVFNEKEKRFDLSEFWPIRQLSFSDCQFVNPNQFREITETQMRIQSYFVSASNYPLPPNTSLEDLIAQGDAIPLQVDILCRSFGKPDSALACDEIRFMNQIIPINPQPPVRENRFVQIRSQFCASDKALLSSGVVVQWEGKKYILTSAFSVLNEETDVCQRIVYANQGLKVHVKRQNWAWGLALLEVDGDISGGFPLLEQTDPWPLQADLGDYSKSQGLPEIRKVSVVADGSSRHFIPNVDQVLEIKGGPFDSSVQGAALFAGKQILGIVSHQYLKIHPGSLTRPTRWSPLQNEISDHLTVITINDILKWLRSPIETDTGLLLRANDAWSEQLTYQSGDLQWMENCPSFDSSQTSSDYPIGGGDAFGIGGDGNNYRACQIRVGPAREKTLSFFSPAHKHFYEDVRESVEKGFLNKIFFRFESLDGVIDSRRDYIYSLESFFQMLRQEITKPFLSIASNQEDVGMDPSLAELRKAGTQLAASSQKVYGQVQSSDPSMGQLVRQIYFLAKLAESEQWKYLKEKDFLLLLDAKGKYEKAWKDLLFAAITGPKMKSDLETLFLKWKSSRR